MHELDKHGDKPSDYRTGCDSGLEALFVFLIILVVLLVILTGCTHSTGDEPDTDQAAAVVAGVIAFHEPTEARRPDVQTKCDECKGTKQVRTKDGNAIVPCSCGENCKCERTGQVAGKPELPNRMLMFTATWCPPCQMWKQNEKPELEKAGWIVNATEAAHIQVFDTDIFGRKSHQYRVTSIPVFIMIDPDGNEVARSSYMDAADTAAFYYANQPEAGQ